MTKTPMPKGSAGFSLIETTVSMALGIVVAVLMMQSATSALRLVRETRRTERLHADSILMVDSISYWIRQAVTLGVPDPETLVVTLPGGTVKRIERAGTALLFDGNSLMSDTIQVSAISFTPLARSVRANITLVYAGSEQSLSFTTTIARRN